MKYIDVHCHVEDFDESLLDNIFASGIDKIICAGADLNTSVKCMRLAESRPQVYFTAGLHPTEVLKSGEDDLKEIEKLASHEKCVAIGEIGLDYHYPDTDKQAQKTAFLKQLEIAGKLGLPVQIHSRDCAEDTYEILKEACPLKAGGLLHCYSYSVEMLKKFEKLGLYFSFGGTSTYKHSKKPRRCAASVSIDKILTETDSPYLPPSSKFGTFPNTPESIIEIAENIAALREIGIEEFTLSVWNNAHKLFKKLNNK